MHNRMSVGITKIQFNCPTYKPMLIMLPNTSNTSRLYKRQIFHTFSQQLQWRKKPYSLAPKSKKTVKILLLYMMDCNALSGVNTEINRNANIFQQGTYTIVRPGAYFHSN